MHIYIYIYSRSRDIRWVLHHVTSDTWYVSWDGTVTWPARPPHHLTCILKAYNWLWILTLVKLLREYEAQRWTWCAHMHAHTHAETMGAYYTCRVSTHHTLHQGGSQNLSEHVAACLSSAVLMSFVTSLLFWYPYLSPLTAVQVQLCRWWGESRRRTHAWTIQPDTAVFKGCRSDTNAHTCKATQADTAEPRRCWQVLNIPAAERRLNVLQSFCRDVVQVSLTDIQSKTKNKTCICFTIKASAVLRDLWAFPHLKSKHNA